MGKHFRIKFRGRHKLATFSSKDIKIALTKNGLEAGRWAKEMGKEIYFSFERCSASKPLFCQNSN